MLVGKVYQLCQVPGGLGWLSPLLELVETSGGLPSQKLLQVTDQPWLEVAGTVWWQHRELPAAQATDWPW